MTSDVVVHKNKRGVKPWRTALIGDELDAEPVIPVSVLIEERLWVEVGRCDRIDHLLDVHAHEGRRALTNGSWRR
jgi:hypothetical protein